MAKSSSSSAETKICTKCGVEKTLDEYGFRNKNVSNPKRVAQCLICIRTAANARAYAKNPDRQPKQSSTGDSKKCSGPCGLVKASSEFSKKPDGTMIGRCKICTAADMKERLHAKNPDREYRKFRDDEETGETQVCKGCNLELDFCKFPEETSGSGLPQKTCTACQNVVKSDRRKKVDSGERSVGQGMAYHHPVINGNKECIKCHEWKDLITCFSTRNDTPHGYFHDCKICRQAAALAYGRSVWNEKLRIRRESDEDLRRKGSHRNRVYNMITDKRFKKDLFDEEIGCKPSFLRRWIETQFSGDMTWESYTESFTIDHIIPLDMFDLMNEDDRYLAFHWTNIQPSSDNFVKHNKYRMDEVAAGVQRAITYIHDKNIISEEMPVIQKTLDWIHSHVIFDN